MFQTIMFDMHQNEWQDKCIEFSQACLPVIDILYSIHLDSIESKSFIFDLSCIITTGW